MEPRTTPDSLTNKAREQVSHARDVVSDAADSAAETVNQGRAAAAERLSATANTVREQAERLPGGARVKQFATGAADGLSATADYVRSHDLQRMVDDVEDVVRTNPGPSLLVAAAVGFLLGRAMSRG